MQEVQYEDGGISREVFNGNTQEEIFNKMRTRFKELESEGNVVGMKRTQLTPNSKCTCGSGKKIKRCCKYL